MEKKYWREYGETQYNLLSDEELKEIKRTDPARYNHEMDKWKEYAQIYTPKLIRSMMASSAEQTHIRHTAEDAFTHIADTEYNAIVVIDGHSRITADALSRKLDVPDNLEQFTMLIAEPGMSCIVRKDSSDVYKLLELCQTAVTKKVGLKETIRAINTTVKTYLATDPPDRIAFKTSPGYVSNDPTHYYEKSWDMFEKNHEGVTINYTAGIFVITEEGIQPISASDASYTKTQILEMTLAHLRVLHPEIPKFKLFVVDVGCNNLDSDAEGLWRAIVSSKEHTAGKKTRCKRKLRKSRKRLCL